MRCPSLWEAVTTAGAVLAIGAVTLVPSVGNFIQDLAWFLLEIVGRILDRPTSRVVLGYAVVTAAAFLLESRRKKLRGAWLIPWQICCFLALLGQGYVLLLAWKLQPHALLGALALGGLIAHRIHKPSSAEPAGRPIAATVGLFVLIHILVEGTAGHILTPWLGTLGTEIASLSRTAPILYWSGVLLVTGAPIALGLWTVRRGLYPIGWLHPDLRRCVDVMSLSALLSLSVVAFHYGTYVTHCPTPDDSDLILLSDVGGVFDLAPSTDGRFLAVSHREARFVELIDLRDGSRRQVGTAQPSDTLFNRTEPETLLALPDGSFLLLAASSDTEQGNLLTHLNPDTGRLSPPLPARGISDVVGDGKGGVWISSEFDGRLARLDPTSGDAPVPLRLPGGTETNKVIVDASSDRAWSVGLWTDPMLRAIDLVNGRQLNAVHLGTHQWDLALSNSLRRLFVPRFVEGRLHIIDADSLKSLGSLKANFGVRPVEVSPDGNLVVTGNVYTGSVVARSADSGEVQYNRRIGGYIKGLRIGADGRTFAGSVCGVWELGGGIRADR